MFSEFLSALKKEANTGFTLKYWDSSSKIYVIHKLKIYDRLITFLSSHFEKTEEDRFTIGYIYLCSYQLDYQKVKEEISSQAEVICIRKSSAIKFNIDCIRYIEDKYQIFDFDKLKTAIIISEETKEIYIFASELSEIVLAEFIRDLYIKDQERMGSCVLHAAGVEKNGLVYAICGKKGSGKSTVLYNLIFEQGYTMFSGDKLIVKIINNRLYIKGWPDYPHLGIGTIRYNKKLSEYFNEIELKNKGEDEKILFDPIAFYDDLKLSKKSEVMELAGFIFPQFCANEGFYIVKCSNVSEEAVSNLEFKEDFEIANWYSYFKINRKKEDKQKQFGEISSIYPGYILRGNINKNVKSIDVL